VFQVELRDVDTGNKITERFRTDENTTIQLDDSFDDSIRRFVRRIQELEVREALKRMKGVKRWALMVSQSRWI